jgi:hypothetical protein
MSGTQSPAEVRSRTPRSAKSDDDVGFPARCASRAPSEGYPQISV